jgi:hypothetical protein
MKKMKNGRYFLFREVERKEKKKRHAVAVKRIKIFFEFKKFSAHKNK